MMSRVLALALALVAIAAASRRGGRTRGCGIAWTFWRASDVSCRVRSLGPVQAMRRSTMCWMRPRHAGLPSGSPGASHLAYRPSRRSTRRA